MKSKFFYFLFLAFISHFVSAQTSAFTWWNPANNSFPVLEGQAWPDEVKNKYDRLPARAEKIVREQVWNLSTQTAGVMIRFRANSGEIRVRYAVGGKQALPHMPATGVSGVDLYAISNDGDWRWCAGKYAFGDTITYNFKNIEPVDPTHKLGREYRLFLPLYNNVKWLEIGVPEGTRFEPLPVRPDKPVVVYGTSIAQGACASRPGMAWTAILGRKLDDPLINLGFSGNGRMEKELIDLVSEIDAKIYILDCLPNLVASVNIPTDEIKKRLLDGVRVLRAKRPETPIVLAEHDGYTDEAINAVSRKSYQDVNVILKEAFAQLKSEGITGIYLIPKEDFHQDIETMVDGTHPTDLGMMRYAEAYEKQIREILREPEGTVSTTIPCTQMRELANYDWEKRHFEILNANKSEQPKIVVIGNSITHFWGGLPKGPRATGADSWDKTFGVNARNMGYGWDRIENVLWRVYHGELDGFTAKQIFVNIGTNNLQMNSDEEILTGWQMLIEAMKYRQPKANISMAGIYPRRQQEERVAKLNAKLKELTKSANVNYVDPGLVLAGKDGKIDESLFSDGLHPNAKGYSILGKAYESFITK
ncbi:SGNH/GDSL hydrolase family protein [Dyadobacter frigoris]|uniref:Acetylhydrolase n=1 Tax=Dyadobacter frigoris TaxID=2576211 RepID=A0A4U6D995_9BACT|nr:SGNH/GDSL hydrolase family protein [Dyadobacter frigoris]TKT92951.1 acetylhydrolase [Dyadobacter frigoris]GLU54261.1 acetylhydrolase [Dyadobacter frigoris]